MLLNIIFTVAWIAAFGVIGFYWGKNIKRRRILKLPPGIVNIQPMAVGDIGFFILDGNVERGIIKEVKIKINENKKPVISYEVLQHDGTDFPWIASVTQVYPTIEALIDDLKRK